MQIAHLLGAAHGDAVEICKETRRGDIAVEINKDVIDLGMDHRQDLPEGFEAAGERSDGRNPPHGGDGAAAPGHGIDRLLARVSLQAISQRTLFSALSPDRGVMSEALASWARRSSKLTAPAGAIRSRYRTSGESTQSGIRRKP